MIRRLVFLVLFVFVSELSLAASLKVGYFSLLPHSPTVEGDVDSGAAVLYFKRIVQKMKINDASEVSITEQSLPKLLFLMEEGQLDAALFMAKNDERAQKFDFPNQAFFNMKPSLALKDTHPLKEVKSVKDLLGLKIGVWEKGFFSPMIKEKGINLEGLGSGNVSERNLKKVMSGRIDAFYSPDKATILYETIHLGIDKSTKVLELPEKSVELFTVFSKKAKPEFKISYEKALKEVQAEQSYEDFLKEFLKKQKKITQN